MRPISNAGSVTCSPRGWLNYTRFVGGLRRNYGQTGSPENKHTRDRGVGRLREMERKKCSGVEIWSLREGKSFE